MKIPERCRRVPVQIPGGVPVRGSGEDTWRGFGRFRCRYLMTFRRVPVKMLGRVPVGSDDDGG